MPKIILNHANLRKTFGLISIAMIYILDLYFFILSHLNFTFYKLILAIPSRSRIVSHIKNIYMKTYKYDKWNISCHISKQRMLESSVIVATTRWWTGEPWGNSEREAHQPSSSHQTAPIFQGKPWGHSG